MEQENTEHNLESRLETLEKKMKKFESLEGTIGYTYNRMKELEKLKQELDKERTLYESYKKINERPHIWGYSSYKILAVLLAIQLAIFIYQYVAGM